MSKIKKVSSDKFWRFVKMRDTGLYNVFDPNFRDAADLTKDETIFIIRNFEKLDKEYNNPYSR